MNRNMSKFMTFLLMLLAFVAAPALAKEKAKIGDSGTIAIPYENMEGGVSPILSVRLVVSSAPAWVVCGRSLALNWRAA